jgi:hypothetical protein
MSLLLEPAARIARAIGRVGREGRELRDAAGAAVAALRRDSERLGRAIEALREGRVHARRGGAAKDGA